MVGVALWCSSHSAEEKPGFAVSFVNSHLMAQEENSLLLGPPVQDARQHEGALFLEIRYQECQSGAPRGSLDPPEMGGTATELWQAEQHVWKRAHVRVLSHLDSLQPHAL